MMGEETTRARLAAGRIHACKAIAGDAMRSGTNHAFGKHIFLFDFIFTSMKDSVNEFVTTQKRG
jgi:hypothetical protein